MLRIHHADEFEPLLDALAAAIGAPGVDPFVPDLVVVPTAGVKDAVTAGLGRRVAGGDGVVANVQFVFPGAFVARALGRARASRSSDPHDADGEVDDQWQIDRLTWVVLQVLAEGVVAVPGGRVDDPLLLARHLADLFDRYATQRPQVLRDWANGVASDGTAAVGGPRLLDDACWQYHLWRAVRERIGVPSPAETLPDLVDRLRSGELVVDVPPRVALVGFGGLSASVLMVARALGAVREVDAFLRHPSSRVWAASPHRLAGALQLREAVDVTASITNPLLASWGRPAAEARAVLNGLPDVAFVDVAEAEVPPATTVLSALQRAVRLDAPLSTVSGVVPDGSLQVHACHGITRQLEVLRDALDDAFCADPTLEAHQVVVLCPDIERVAPLVDAVLGGGSLPVPVRLADRSLGREDPLGAALDAALALVDGRATITEVLAFLERAPVRRRFGLEVAEVEMIVGWSSTLGARWGFSAEHRAPWGLRGISVGTWRSVVDRLLAGVAMPAPVPRVGLVLAGDDRVAPFDDLGTDQVHAVGGFAELVARLVDLHAATRAPRPIDEWVDVLHDAADALLAPDRDEPWRLGRLHRALDGMLDAATAHGVRCAVPLSFASIRAAVGRLLSDTPGHVEFRSGSVTVTSMLPLHGVPARLVCLVGLDDAATRSGAFDGDDILSATPCIGERHPRHDNRQVLLDAVLATADRLIITCDGHDLTTNQPVPFVVPLAELLDAVGAITGGARDVVVQHPRHGFAERVLGVPDGHGRALVPWAANRAFTFDPHMHDAAEAVRVRRVAARADAAEREALVDAVLDEHLRAGLRAAFGIERWSLPPSYPTALIDEAGTTVPAFEVSQLFEAARGPARLYVSSRLDARLPDRLEAPDDGLSLTVAGLEAWQLGDSLLSVLRRGGDVEEWAEAASLDGNLPPGALAAAALADAAALAAALVEATASHGLPLAGETLDVRRVLRLPLDRRVADIGTLALSDVLVRGRLGDVHIGADGTATIVRTQFGRIHPSHRLIAALSVALGHLERPDLVWSAVTVAPTDLKKQPIAAERVRLHGDAPSAAAESLLLMAVQLTAWSLRDRVPFLECTSDCLAHGRPADVGSAISDDMRDARTARLWGDLTVDEVHHAPLRADDPAVLADLGAPSRFAATAQWVWGTVKASVTREQVDLGATAATASSVPS